MKVTFPDWAGFTPEVAAKELPRHLEAAEKAVAAIEQARPTTYEDFVWALDEATRGLYRCWSQVSHLLSVMNSDGWRKVEEDWQPKVVAFGLRVSQSKPIYEIAKALLATGSLEPTRWRIVEKMVQNAELAGVGLTGARKDRYNEIQMRLAQLASDFHNAVIDSTTPEIADAAYTETMKHEADRAKRERIYRARATRAPGNAPRLAEILKLRHEQAGLLGFANHAERSLAGKSAPSVAAVMKMIDDLDAATAAKAEAEKLPGEPWDIDFEAEKLRERKYSYSEEELKKHFELNVVMKGLFRMVKFLFDVDVVEITDAKPPVWNPDVRFFAIQEKGQTIANLYYDPYVRTGRKVGGAWMNEFRNRNRTTLPLVVIVTNFEQPDAKGECHLTFRDVETLFHEFGHALQCMLTRIEEEDAAGINLIEWDAVEIASQFLENWCLDDRTGIVLPAELKRKVLAAKNYRAATACRRQLTFAKTDITLHLGPVEDPNAIKSKFFAHFGLPMIPEDIFLCTFKHIFAGGYDAGYYGYKWAEVMAADCYGAFEEAGLADDAAVKAVGKRYRETILGLGGSRSALDVFRLFRGRDPEIAAMLRQQDLT